MPSKEVDVGCDVENEVAEYRLSWPRPSDPSADSRPAPPAADSPPLLTRVPPYSEVSGSGTMYGSGASCPLAACAAVLFGPSSSVKRSVRAFCWWKRLRRLQKKSARIRAASATMPPITPPTIAPVFDLRKMSDYTGSCKRKYHTRHRHFRQYRNH